MTKLKKKKGKKRAKGLFAVDLLDSPAVRDDFDHVVFGTPGDREAEFSIDAESLLWGFEADPPEVGPVFQAVVQGRLQEAADQLHALNLAGLFDRLDFENAFELLAAVELLTGRPDLLDKDTRIDLIGAVYAHCVEGSQIGHSADMLEFPVVHQIVFGEVPLRISLRFPQLSESALLFENARNELQVGVAEMLDNDGLPHARILSECGWLLACWTRCCRLADRMDTECLDVDTQLQFGYFLRQMMRLIRRDGSLTFGSHATDVRTAIHESLDCYHDEDDRLIADAMLDGRKISSTLEESMPEPSELSEWGKLAVMQSRWSSVKPRLTVDFDQHRLRAELHAGSVLLSGELTTRITGSGKPVGAACEWEVVCWHSDEDGDFLELECELDNGGRWQKHFLLAQQDAFLLVGDVLLDLQESSTHLETSWPLGVSTGFGLPQDSTELFLTHDSKSVASVLPLGLPEWQSGRSPGTLGVSESRLEYRFSSAGENIYSPIFLDLNAKRCRKPLTWRRLTVAEDLEIVSPQTAVAFRIQAGKRQWLIYRSLTPPENRTMLGQNLTVEFYAGRFNRDGTCTEIVSVD